MTKICVLGLGYIGLPTALLFAQGGFTVVGIDINEKIVQALNNGELPLNEPGLDDLFLNARSNFTAQTEMPEADVFLIAVPTPLKRSIRVSDLDYVRSAAEMISLRLRKGNLVILESTVPPGTCENFVLPILEKSGLKRGDFFCAHCPERAIPGKTLHEMINNDRIVGGIDKKSVDLTKEIYSSFVKGRIFTTDAKTAEFVKLIENTSRDVNIALANELAQIADNCGIDVWEAIGLANKHPRVQILQPGPGVGGHCIAIDPLFLTENSTQTRIIHIARDINESMPNYVIHNIRDYLYGLKDPTISVFGVSYKGDIEDTRETPALKFIQLARNEGYQVKCHDPCAKKFEYELLEMDKATEDSDCIVLITDHKAFRHIDPSMLNMRNRNLIDTRNFLDHDKWRDCGFNVKILGNGLDTGHSHQK